MQIVIDIPKETWKRIKDGYVPLGISKYLKNGIPLREGKWIPISERLPKAGEYVGDVAKYYLVQK